MCSAGVRQSLEAKKKCTHSTVVRHYIIYVYTSFSYFGYGNIQVETIDGCGGKEKEPKICLNISGRRDSESVFLGLSQQGIFHWSGL